MPDDKPSWPPSKRRGGGTAGELIARLRADPEFEARMRAIEAERRPGVEALRAAERPIVDDLQALSLQVESVWDLVNTSVPYPAALPVLLRHLEKGGYPDRVMEGLACAMAVRPATFAWDTLRRLYARATGPGEEEGLAVALAASATPAQLDDLILLLADDSRGDTRIHFLRAIKRVGKDRGRQLLASLRDDPLYGQEARALLGRRTLT